MCFKNKNRDIMLLNRVYLFASGHYSFYINKKDKCNRILTFNLTNDKGEIRFVLTDKLTNEVEELNNPVTGKYEFLIKRDHPYKFEIFTKSSSGKYEVRIKNREDVL